jgi:hypothetical protein
MSFSQEEAIKALDRLQRYRTQNAKHSAKSYLRKKMREYGCSTIDEYDAMKKNHCKPRKYNFDSV